jgi:hypothetical protein
MNRYIRFMENISRAPSAAASPTRLDLIARGGCASPAYLDVDATLWRARRMLGSGTRSAPIAALRALATRRLLLTYGVQAEERIATLVRAARS